jgi:hypothetical protein
MSPRALLRVGLQIVGAITLFLAVPTALLYVFAASGLGATRIERELVSPNGQYRAVHAATSTGAVGYCYQFVVLIPAIRPVEVPSYSKSKDLAVFAVQCGAQMEIEWLDDSNLKVSLNLVRSNDASVVRMRREDSSSHVLVKYEINTQ